MEEPIFTGGKLGGFVVCLAISATVLSMRTQMRGPGTWMCVLPAAALAGAAIGILWKREVECALTFAIIVGFWLLLQWPVR
jgi:hypothetical protein